MEFNERQMEILYRAWVLARKGCGQVLEAWAYPEAVRRTPAGWSGGTSTQPATGRGTGRSRPKGRST
jgi:hypothetical protein